MRLIYGEKMNKYPKTISAVRPFSFRNVWPCVTKMFLKIFIFLSIFLLHYQFSVASAERSFSALRRLKTWLRSSMGEDRLSGLALLNVHRDMNVDIENIIARFAASSKRNMNFVIWCIIILCNKTLLFQFKAILENKK